MFRAFRCRSKTGGTQVYENVVLRRGYESAPRMPWLLAIGRKLRAELGCRRATRLGTFGRGAEGAFCDDISEFDIAKQSGLPQLRCERRSKACGFETITAEAMKNPWPWPRPGLRTLLLGSEGGAWYQFRWLRLVRAPRYPDPSREPGPISAEVPSRPEWPHAKCIIVMPARC
jgi:hypothetical protein